MKIQLFMLALSTAFIFWAFPTGRINAANQPTCGSFQINGQNDVFAIPSDIALTFTFNLSDSQPAAYDPAGSFTAVFSSGPNRSNVKPVGGVISFTQDAGTFSSGKTYTIKLNYDPPSGNLITVCTNSFGISATDSGNCNITIDPPSPSSRESITATVTLNKTGNYKLIYDPIRKIRYELQGLTQGDNVNIPIFNYGIGNATLEVSTSKASSILGNNFCPLHFQVTENGGALEAQFTDLCSFAQGEKARKACTDCVGIWTAIGCVPTTPDGFVKKILPFAMGLGGGIAFLLMLFGALQIMTSAGNPEKLNAGKELVTSAIVGLLLIIFSVFLLKLIGADILGVPGFGGTP